MAVLDQHLQALFNAVHGTQLEPLFSTLSQVAFPRIGVQLIEPDDSEDLPVGASKLGGFPDVPPDFVWRSHQGVPLAFIGQFRLDELAKFDSALPTSGLLSVFCDYTGSMWGHEAEDKSGWHLEIFPFENLQERLPTEDEDGAIYCDFAECKVEFKAEFDLPDTSELESKLSDKQSELYSQLLTSETHFFGFGRSTLGERGIPRSVLEFLFPNAPIEEVSLLLRVGSEWKAGMNWGDADWLEIYVPTKDLQKGNFHRSWSYVVI